MAQERVPRYALAAASLCGLDESYRDSAHCGLVVASRLGCLAADLDFLRSLEAGEPFLPDVIENSS